MPRLKLKNVTTAPVARILRTRALDIPGRRRAELSVTGMICAL
jgi:hypothetical protein